MSVSESGDRVDGLAAELGAAKNETAEEVAGLTGEVDALTAELVRAAQSMAENMRSDSKASASEREALHARLTAEIDKLRLELKERATIDELSRSFAASELADEEIRRNLDYALDMLEELELEGEASRVPIESPSPEPVAGQSDPAPSKVGKGDKHRGRWEEHLRVHAELQKKRASKPYLD